MDREQIKKALEYCTSGGSCNKCPYDDNPRLSFEGCLVKKMTDALALIKELTEENERLLARNFDLAEKGEKVVIAYKKLSEENNSLHASCTELTQNLHECKADTVCEMQKTVDELF